MMKKIGWKKKVIILYISALVIYVVGSLGWSYVEYRKRCNRKLPLSDKVTIITVGKGPEKCKMTFFDGKNTLIKFVPCGQEVVKRSNSSDGPNSPTEQ